MEVPTNPTRESAFVWICGSFLISANEIRVSREDFFGSGTETHGDSMSHHSSCTPSPKSLENSLTQEFEVELFSRVNEMGISAFRQTVQIGLYS